MAQKTDARLALLRLGSGLLGVDSMLETAVPPNTESHRRPTEAVSRAIACGRLDADAVYIFAWPGYLRETRSNRWYYARLWSQTLPVVILQAELNQHAEIELLADPSLLNVTIARIMGNDAPPLALRPVNLVYGAIQAQQISQLQRRLAHRRPIFWGYTPHFLYSYATLPAVLRVHHATENYFDFPEIDRMMLATVRAMMTASDLVVCCSSGVQSAVQQHAGTVANVTVSNGCDYAFFSQAVTPNDTVRAGINEIMKRGPFAVFAGNINRRLDFGLLAQLADTVPELQIVMIGPVEPNLPHDDRTAWIKLGQRQNVHPMAAVPIEALPWIYSQADLGIIPYRTARFLVENGFPLKALEMVAAGKRVVSTYMRPLEEVSSVIDLAHTNDEFVDLCKRHLTDQPNADFQAKAESTARAFDYEARFSTVLDAIMDALGNPMAAPPLRSVEPRSLGYPIISNRAKVFWRLVALIEGKLKLVIPVPIKVILRRIYFRGN